MELNPKHPTTNAMHNQWHKVLGLAMKQLNLSEIVITQSEILDLGDNAWAVVAEERHDGLHIRLVSMEEGKRLAREAGNG